MTSHVLDGCSAACRPLAETIADSAKYGVELNVAFSDDRYK